MRAVAVLVCALAVPVLTGAGGGTVAPGEPRISGVQCVTDCIKPSRGVVGSKIRLTGSDLQDVEAVSLPRADGTRATDFDPTVKPSGVVVAEVKKGAVTGSVRIRDTFSQVRDSSDAFQVGTMDQLRKAQSGWRFPVRGPHDYGSSMSRFGAPRSGHTHQGQDVSAACGTKLVAARGGKVKYAGYQAAGAGNYIVIDAAKWKFDYVYMHLTKPAAVKEGETVTTGQKVGKVGETGDASGCHLHFEKWSPTGWYSGGHPVDPLSTLEDWDRFS